MDANKKKQAEKLVKIYDDGENYKWYMPLRFWFCMKSGLALPTLAMTNTNIRIEFELEDINNFIKNMPIKPNNINVIEWKYEYTKTPTARLDLISDLLSGLLSELLLDSLSGLLSDICLLNNLSLIFK